MSVALKNKRVVEKKKSPLARARTITRIPLTDKSIVSDHWANMGSEASVVLASASEAYEGYSDNYKVLGGDTVSLATTKSACEEYDDLTPSIIGSHVLNELAKLNLICQKQSEQIKTLYSKINKNKINNIAIKNLHSKKLILLDALYITLEFEDDIHIAYSNDLNIFGYGETELNAIRDFSQELEDLYFNLKKEKKLGKFAKETNDFLLRIIKEV